METFSRVIDILHEDDGGFTNITILSTSEPMADELLYAIRTILDQVDVQEL